MKKYVVITTLLAGALLSRASAVTIDFEDQAANAFPGFIGGGGPVADTSLATDQYHSLGVDFSGVAFIVLGVGHATSGAIGLAGLTDVNRLTYSGTYFTAVFDGVTDFVSVRADKSGANGNLILSAFDILGNLITTDTKNDGGGATLSISATGIHHVTFTGNGTAALDDFSFNTPTPIDEPPVVVVPGVPDAGSTVLLLGGSIAALAGYRRRISARSTR